MGMLGDKRNRIKHGIKECTYGCCRSLITGTKSKTRGILRTRENRKWKKEEGT